LSDAAVFMDRDGTVIVDAGYPSRAEQVELLPDTAAALARLKADGFKLVVISNQSGIGRGLVTEADAQRVHARFVAVLADAGVDLDGAYYCPHAPEDACTCRKPSPELILRAARELDLDPGRSFMVGDRDSDLESGRRAGCRTILLGRPTDGGPVADHVAGSWADVCEYVERVAKPAAA
jgi:D-glycero-D-manno-heptose 1,7-bisphosphate phosphatase